MHTRSSTELAQLMDLTLLRPEATRAEFERYCKAARELKLHGVCVPGSRIIEAVALLEATEVKVISVVGFPTGAADPDVKRYETEAAVDSGAHEVELVVNVGWLKEAQDSRILRELRDVIEAADERPVGVMMEAALLTREEKLRLLPLAAEAGAKSVVLGTGYYASHAASTEDVKLLQEAVGNTLGIKAVGKVADSRAALALVSAGATRLGIAEPTMLLER